jgi:protoporphyrinogen oxidase
MRSETKIVGIVGGGLMGVCLAYHLSQMGVKTEVFEATSQVGGLAGSITLQDGTQVDRHYHAILSSDQHLRSLCADLGISDQLRFRETRMGFFHNDRIHSMNSIVEFLRFPPLGWIDRFRLGVTVLYAQLVRDWYQLEGVNVEEWLVRLSGRRTYENIWRPLLKAKFDGNFAEAPATYIWARLVRMKSTRSGANQKEEAGHLIGGYTTLLEALVREIEAAGGHVHLNSPVDEIQIEDGRAKALRVEGRMRPFDAIVVTLQLPLFRRLVPGANRDYLDYLGRTQYLGIVAPLLVLDRALTGYWTLNITDDRIPFTGIIETTTYIDPQYVGGHHLAYLPKYTAPGSHWQQMTDDEIREVWLQHLEAMFPGFDRSWIQYFLVHRERYVEPLHGLNQTDLIPAIQTPIEDLYLATTAQIYPALTNGESVSRHALAATETILSRVSPLADPRQEPSGVQQPRAAQQGGH